MTTSGHRIGRDEVVWAFEPNMEAVAAAGAGMVFTGRRHFRH